jgi:hypothetical protein
MKFHVFVLVANDALYLQLRQTCVCRCARQRDSTNTTDRGKIQHKDLLQKGHRNSDCVADMKQWPWETILGVYTMVALIHIVYMIYEMERDVGEKKTRKS